MRIASISNHSWYFFVNVITYPCTNCMRIIITIGNAQNQGSLLLVKTIGLYHEIVMGKCKFTLEERFESGHYFVSGEVAIHDDVIKWKHFPRYWPFVRGIHRSPVNSPHKGQWRGAVMFSLICARIIGWVNNGEAGDLRRQHAYYDVIVMTCGSHRFPQFKSMWQHNAELNKNVEHLADHLGDFAIYSHIVAGLIQNEKGLDNTTAWPAFFFKEITGNANKCLGLLTKIQHIKGWYTSLQWTP